jgi:hypothetical protein
VGCAAGFIVWNLAADIEVFRRVEVGFAAAAVALCASLYLLYRNPRARAGDEFEPGSSQELEARLAIADESL